jgi:hypothetical protein
MTRKFLQGRSEFGVSLLIAAALTISGTIAGCSEGYVSFMQKTGFKKSEPLFFAPSDEDIVDDADTAGLKIIKDVISVTFRPDTDEISIKKIISSVNGEIVGYDKAVNYYQIRFKGKSLEEVGAIRLGLLATYKEIEIAVTIPVSTHRNPYYVK